MGPQAYLSRVGLGLALFLFAVPAHACEWLSPHYVQCTLTPGTTTITAKRYDTIAFVNTGNEHLQVNSLSAKTGEHSYGSEFCANRNLLSTDQPTEPGIGEVGCVTKNPGEDYPPLTFGKGTGLAIAPGETFYFGFNPASPADHRFTLVVAPQTTGLFSWRGANYDEIEPCTKHSNPWTPLVNRTGRVVHLIGVTVYAVSAVPSHPDTVTSACVGVFRLDGSMRWSRCGINTRGDVNLPTQLVNPGESIVGWARNDCNYPNHWGWVGYFHVW